MPNPNKLWKLLTELFESEPVRRNAHEVYHETSGYFPRKGPRQLRERSAEELGRLELTRREELQEFIDTLREKVKGGSPAEKEGLMLKLQKAADEAKSKKGTRMATPSEKDTSTFKDEPVYRDLSKYKK